MCPSHLSEATSAIVVDFDLTNIYLLTFYTYPGAGRVSTPTLEQAGYIDDNTIYTKKASADREEDV